MSEVKRYEATTEWGNPVMSEYDFGEYVNYEDYAALKAECDALAAENAQMRIAINHTIGWQESVDSENTESVRPLHELDTPATDAYANQLRVEGGAKALEDFADFNVKSIDPDSDEYTEVLMEVSRAARGFAANLRKENGND